MSDIFLSKLDDISRPDSIFCMGFDVVVVVVVEITSLFLELTSVQVFSIAFFRLVSKTWCGSDWCPSSEEPWFVKKKPLFSIMWPHSSGFSSSPAKGQLLYPSQANSEEMHTGKLTPFPRQMKWCLMLQSPISEQWIWTFSSWTRICEQFN